MKLFQKKSPAAPTDDRLAALTAEYQNYRRRTADAEQQAAHRSARQTILAFLPLYDDLERALAAECRDAAYYHGVELVMQKLLAILASMQVQPMQSLGKCFNPQYHEAVEHIEDANYRQEEIAKVLQTGFTMDEDVIRHAKVVVAN